MRDRPHLWYREGYWCCMDGIWIRDGKQETLCLTERSQIGKGTSPRQAYDIWAAIKGFMRA
jgi:hypothetical protein